jgi:uncharacterized tellurite resistance protein B-like protein
MDDATGRRVCELIAGIIATDGVLHPSELQFMLTAFAKFGVASGDDTEAIVPAVTPAEASKAMASLPEEVRDEAVGLLIESAAADGNVSPEERDYLFAVARAAGLSRDHIDDRIANELIKSVRAGR